MKIVCALLLLGVSLTVFRQSGAQKNSTQPFNLKISTSQTVVKSGAPVLLHIVLTNLSQQNITVFKSPGWGSAQRHYFISVTDSVGNETSSGDYILKKEGRSGSRIMVTLKPGDQLEEDATISKMFDLKSSGLYQVFVKRQSPLDPDVFIQSNVISMTVTD